MSIIKTIGLGIVTSIFFLSCARIAEDVDDGKILHNYEFGILCFDNTYETDSSLLKFLNEHKELERISLESLQDTLLDNLQVKIEIPQEMIKGFMKYNCISCYYSNMGIFHDTISMDSIYNSFLKSSKLYYCGQLNLVDSIETYLFLTESEIEYIIPNVDRKIYLLNIKKGKIMSAVLAFSYYFGIGDESYMQILRDKKNTFILKDKTLFSDCIGSDYENDNEEPIKFSINKNGQIIRIH